MGRVVLTEVRGVNVSQQLPAGDQGKQHQPVHPGGLQRSVPGRIPLPDKVHILRVPDHDAEAAAHGIHPGFRQGVEIVVQVILHPGEAGFRCLGLAQHGAFPLTGVHQEHAAVLRAADRQDVFDHFLHDFAERFVLPQLDAGADHLHRGFLGDIQGHQVVVIFRKKHLGIGAVADVFLFAFHRHKIRHNVEIIAGRVHAVVDGLLQDRRAETDLLEVQVLRDVARVLAARNKLHLLRAVQADRPGREGDGIDIFLIAGDDADLSAFSVRLFFDRQHAGHRIKMIGDPSPVHAVSSRCFLYGIFSVC